MNIPYRRITLGIALTSAIAGSYVTGRPEPTLSSIDRTCEVEPAVLLQVDAATQNPLAINGMNAYNALLPTIANVSRQKGVPQDVLAIIALTESRGEGGTRYEAGFAARYIDPLFIRDRRGRLPDNRFTRLFENLRQNDPALTSNEFKRQLSSSTGPMQVMYTTAIERGFSGTFSELATAENNILFAARHLQAKCGGDYTLDRALRAYNTGSVTGTPHPGYLERAHEWQQRLNR